MSVRAPEITPAYDHVGAYDQDAINGFSAQLIDQFLALVHPLPGSQILDAMAGNGNLTLRLYEYCQRRGIALPQVTLLELSRVQCELARTKLAFTPANVVWGDLLTLEDFAQDCALPTETFDRVMIKSGSHEIPLAQQAELYRNVWQLLKPGGWFVNLGFLFEDDAERDEFREITRFKDRQAGLESAAINRHFLLRDELYSRLQEAGFAEIRCGMSIQYTIRALVGVQAYFPPQAWERMHAELQAQQVRALTMRRKGRIQFYDDTSVMLCPGEITLARRPDECPRRVGEPGCTLCSRPLRALGQ